MSRQDTTEAEAQVEKGQFLLEEQTLNRKNSVMYGAGFLRPTVCG